VKTRAYKKGGWDAKSLKMGTKKAVMPKAIIEPSDCVVK
jgi:hypothetical protein